MSGTFAIFTAFIYWIALHPKMPYLSGMALHAIYRVWRVIFRVSVGVILLLPLISLICFCVLFEILRNCLPHRVKMAWLDECVYVAATEDKRDPIFGKLKKGDEIWKCSNKRSDMPRNTRPNISSISRLYPTPNRSISVRPSLAIQCRPISGIALVRNGNVIKSRVSKSILCVNAIRPFPRF
jgi:hypothetical protein